MIGRMPAHARPELLASADWLAENLGHPEVSVLDVRWRPDGSGRVAFAEGHVPNAVYLDWRDALGVPGPEDLGVLLAPPDHVAEALASAGIGNGSTVVVYDDTASLYAARAWWSLRACGLESVRILDGGYPAWIASGRPVSHAVPAVCRATYVPMANQRARLTTADVHALIGSPDALILDARSPIEYRGLQAPGRRLGHIPGALNMPAGALTEPGTQRFLEGGALRGLLARTGVVRERRIVCYDTTGVAAAKIAFVLALMGYDDVAVYDGGWLDWASRSELPVDGESPPRR
jgi:thiosulfate/3-mercaptopyruvate sulfurtransferase